MMPGWIELASVIACLTFGLFIIFPISWFELKDSMKKGIHPAHKPFYKTLIFEGIAFALCWFLFMLSIFSGFTNFQFRQMVIFCFYCSIHLTYLSLHNCLAMKTKTKEEL